MDDETRILHGVQRYKDGWDEALASLKSGDVLPGGLMVVPVEPTAKMMDAKNGAQRGVYTHYLGPTGIHWSDSDARGVAEWAAMLAAAKEG